MIAPAPDTSYADTNPDNQFMIVGSFSFFCEKHPWEIEKLNREQISVINEYPITKQFYKQTDLYNRRNRRWRDRHKG
jgi:hypothetical protein